MRIDTKFVDSALPLVQQLVAEDATPQWSQLRELHTLNGILENGRVSEENNRPLTFEEWTSLWSKAVDGKVSDQQGMRQQFMYDNMRTSVKHLHELAEVLRYFKQNSDLLGAKIETRVKRSLPSRAHLPESITLVLGTTSSGYVNETGIYVDLISLFMFYSNPDMINDLLTHESWHFGHESLLETHTYLTESWFMPLAQLQSEGIVNYLIGGTLEINKYRIEHGEGEAKKRSQRFVEYSDTMEQRAEQRLNELLASMEKLLHGDMETFMAYTQSLPDIPGYLHGVLMSKQIDEAFGRDTLIYSTTDPMRFLVLSVEAAREQGLELNISDSTLKRWKELIRKS